MTNLIQIQTPEELDLKRRIAEHNARANEIAVTVGTNCQPFQKSPVSAAADLSRIPAAERGGVQEVRV
jgi:hypothetical protein